jgi:ribonuclease-3
MSAPGIPELEKSIGYSFSDKNLLVEAVTHKSYHHENPGEAPAHNERLEFLGDSVLGLAVVEYLFRAGEPRRESTMSKIKSHIVKDKALSEAAREISLGMHLRLGKGEAETSGRDKASILADAMEAVIGAVYVDGGFEEARRLVLRLFRDRLERALTLGEFHDYKTALQEESQTRFGELPQYRLSGEEGRDHDKLFTMEVFIGGRRWGTGTGRSKKEAQSEAAREALERIAEEPA